MDSKLNSVNIGMNKYCGPAVLSILTGRSTDDCASVISRINGQYKVEGVKLTDLLKAADKLGFTNKSVEPASTLFGTLTRLANDDGMYIVTVTGHFVAIEVSNKRIYFCDNHTKVPMPAASSARMMQHCLGVNKVFRKPEPKVIHAETVIQVRVFNNVTYDDPDYNKQTMSSVREFKSRNELQQYIDGLKIESDSNE